jgi:hypothetical protein
VNDENIQLTDLPMDIDAGINVRFSGTYLHPQRVAKRDLEPIYAGRDQNG